MTCLHEIDVGAYVLGALEPEERERVARHIADCPDCRAALRELEGLPRWLAQVPPPAALPDHPVPSELAFRRLQRSATGTGTPTRASARRPAHRGHRRFLAVAAAAVAIGAAGLTGVVATAGSALTTVSASAGPVHAKAALTDAGPVTRIALSMAGVSSGQRCELVAEDRDGRWASAGWWTVNYSGDVRFSGRVPMDADTIQRLVVRTSDGRTLVSMQV